MTPVNVDLHRVADAGCATIRYRQKYGYRDWQALFNFAVLSFLVSADPVVLSGVGRRVMGRK